MGAKRFKNYGDLRGANISSSGITSGTAFVLRRMLAGKGLQTPKDYNLINVGPSAQSYLALTTSRLDAALIAVPLSSDAAEIGVEYHRSSVRHRTELSAHEISTRRSWAEKNRRVMVRFMKAMARAMRRLYDNKEAAIEFLAKEMRLKAEHARKGWEFYTEQNIWNPNGEANVEGVRTVIQIMGERGLLKAPLPNPAKYLDHSYAEEALKELGKR